MIGGPACHCLIASNGWISMMMFERQIVADVKRQHELEHQRERDGDRDRKLSGEQKTARPSTAYRRPN